MNKKIPLKIIVAFAAVLGIAADQIIKYFIVTVMKETGTTVPIINNVLHITYELNDGAAFSSLKGQVWVLCGVTSVIMGSLIYIFCSKKVNHTLAVWAIGLIISGGIGNLIDRFFRGDRLFFGEVVDYVDFRLINFAVFNLADCFVVIGTALIIIYLVFFDKSESKSPVVSTIKEETKNE